MHACIHTYTHTCIHIDLLREMSNACISGEASSSSLLPRMHHTSPTVDRYICMYVCMYVCMHACMHARVYACMYICMYVRMHAGVQACIHVCMTAKRANPATLFILSVPFNF